MSKSTDNLRKATEDAASRIDRLEAQLYRTKAYFEAYALNNDGRVIDGEIPGFNSTAIDIFNEVDALLGEK